MGISGIANSYSGLAAILYTTDEGGSAFYFIFYFYFTFYFYFYFFFIFYFIFEGRDVT